MYLKRGFEYAMLEFEHSFLLEEEIRLLSPQRLAVAAPSIIIPGNSYQ